ncbi:MAG: histidine kinase N-terminal domain-containing protein [Flavonifractor plautii]
MISATRMLCQKYTDLTDAEISYLESYGALLPALANAEQADVFIDCRTVSGRSAIVVCEAKPQTVPSNYRSSILGMLIHWRDELGGGPLLPSGGSHLRGAGGLHAGGPPDRPVGGTPLL